MSTGFQAVKPEIEKIIKEAIQIGSFICSASLNDLEFLLDHIQIDYEPTVFLVNNGCFGLVLGENYQHKVYYLFLGDGKVNCDNNIEYIDEAVCRIKNGNIDNQSCREWALNS